ncbi:unnamed protein product [Acanthoscelides obtectus]|uniref:Uncharacterized protein n=1 Tax=Acanthoscelides obtectus TaxID=200917 RepID=A0A9P0KM57_ACAOB|nr:unnamed protein product [Acanthoscelides obtectus]CAK1665009.1 hypothetical protein AOBTE_LOCUS24608 [Acanthoscelides obtectus]
MFSDTKLQGGNDDAFQFLRMESLLYDRMRLFGEVGSGFRLCTCALFLRQGNAGTLLVSSIRR